MLRVQNGQRAGQLPAEVTGFVGRRAELSQLVKLLSDSRLVTVTGTGGVGKTRLAARAAAMTAGGYRGAVFLAELSELRDPGLLGRTVATALGLPEQEAQSGLDAVLNRVRDRRLLLILDTCEHLVDECATLAATILSQAAGVTLLATSRQPLDVPGESVLPLAPLPLPLPLATQGDPGSDALKLFAQRGAAAAPGFTINDANIGDAIRICRRLDGVPLAIELAAVRLRALPLRDLADRLDRQFQVLDTARRAAGPDRHQTLRNGIAWSYGLCSAAEQTVWERVSVFAGSFDIRAAEAVCADDGLSAEEVTTAIIGLVDKSVVPRSDTGGTRYRLLDTIREFGAARLAESGAECAVKTRHAAWYLDAARKFQRSLIVGDQSTDLARLRLDNPNIRAALSYVLDGPWRPPGPAQGVPAQGVPAQGVPAQARGIPAQARREPGTALDPQADRESRARRDREAAALTAGLGAYWQISGRFEEGRHWLSKVLARFPDPGPERAQTLLDSSRLGTFQGNPAATAEALEGTRIALELGDERLTASGYLAQTFALTLAGRYAEALDASQEAERRLTALGSGIGLLILDSQLGLLLTLDGQFARAIERCRQGLERLGDSAGERWLRGYFHAASAVALYHEGGRQSECLMAVREGLAAKSAIGDIAGTALSMEVFAWLAADADRGERAAWLLGAADALWQRMGGRLGKNRILEKAHQDAADKARGSIPADRFDALFADGASRPASVVASRAVADADTLDGPVARLDGREAGSVGREAGPGGRDTDSVSSGSLSAGAIGPGFDVFGSDGDETGSPGAGSPGAGSPGAGSPETRSSGAGSGGAGSSEAGSHGADRSRPGARSRSGTGARGARIPAARAEAAGAEAAGDRRAALTRRETEIAGLVSGGLSNRQVAEKLVISVRTVDAHVDHIFTKLGISSRVDLAKLMREP